MTWVLIDTMGWDAASQSDKPTGVVMVSFMVVDFGHSGRYLRKECRTPEELWNYLTALSQEQTDTLYKEFGFEERIPQHRTVDDLLAGLL